MNWKTSNQFYETMPTSLFYSFKGSSLNGFFISYSWIHIAFCESNSSVFFLICLVAELSGKSIFVKIKYGRSILETYAQNSGEMWRKLDKLNSWLGMAVIFLFLLYRWFPIPFSFLLNLHLKKCNSRYKKYNYQSNISYIKSLLYTKYCDNHFLVIVFFTSHNNPTYQR